MDAGDTAIEADMAIAVREMAIAPAGPIGAARLAAMQVAGSMAALEAASVATSAADSMVAAVSAAEVDSMAVAAFMVEAATEAGTAKP